MSDMPDIRLHRTPGGYQIAGTRLVIARRAARRDPKKTWRLFTWRSATLDWLDDVGLTGATFLTLTDLKRTLAVFLHHSPPPAAPRPPRLYATTGGYRTSCDTYTVAAIPGPPRHRWQVTADDQNLTRCATLIGARHAIADAQDRTR